jgi:antitoxin (DNA-binding transcriptional repressor) of toxin-antitoxin stability system
MKIELKEIQNRPEILDEIIRENQELIITQNNEPIYQLIRINQSEKKRRHRGSAKGLITMSSDFDEPLPEFEDDL